MKQRVRLVSLAAVLIFSPQLGSARDLDDNPPGPEGGPGTNWENPPGPEGGPGASPDRRYRSRINPPGPVGGPAPAGINGPIATAIMTATTIRLGHGAAQAPTGRILPGREAVQVHPPTAGIVESLQIRPIPRGNRRLDKHRPNDAVGRCISPPLKKSPLREKIYTSIL